MSEYKLLLKGGEEYLIDGVELRMFEESYPQVDVQKELGKMAAWCLANPQKRKTMRGIKRFVVAWLNRAPEKRKVVTQFAASHKPFEPEPPKQINREVGIERLAELKRAMKR
jgi:hypothetical protein